MAPALAKPSIQVLPQASGQAVLVADGQPIAHFQEVHCAHAFSLYPEALSLVMRLVDALQHAPAGGPLDRARVGSAVTAGRNFLQVAHLRGLGVTPPPVRQH